MDPFRKQVLMKRGRLSELRQELKRLYISAQGDIIAITEIFDGFTDLLKMDVAQGLAQARELLDKQTRAREVQKEIDRIVESMEDL